MTVVVVCVVLFDVFVIAAMSGVKFR